MKIGLILTATNPKSLRYDTFFATVQSWSRYVDEIVLVDGGTSDGSFDVFDPSFKEKIRLVSTAATRWDLQSHFSPNHINTMINEGLRSSHSDWVVVAGADFVLSKFNREALILELSELKDEFWIRFKRYKYKLTSTMQEKVYDDRGAVLLNLRKVRNLDFFPNLMGISAKSNIINDYPIYPRDYCGLIIDKWGTKTLVPRGETLHGGDFTTDNIMVYVPDHFFYSRKLAVFQRLKFFEYFNSRAIGTAPYSRVEAKCMIGKSRKKIDLEKFLKLDLPEDFKNLVRRNITSDCIGLCAIDKQNVRYYRVFLSALRKLRTYVLRAKGYRGVFESVNWTPDRNNVEYISLYNIYEKQNTFINHS